MPKFWKWNKNTKRNEIPIDDWFALTVEERVLAMVEKYKNMDEWNELSKEQADFAKMVAFDIGFILNRPTNIGVYCQKCHSKMGFKIEQDPIDLSKIDIPASASTADFTELS